MLATRVRHKAEDQPKSLCADLNGVFEICVLSAGCQLRSEFNSKGYV